MKFGVDCTRWPYGSRPFWSLFEPFWSKHGFLKKTVNLCSRMTILEGKSGFWRFLRPTEYQKWPKNHRKYHHHSKISTFWKMGILDQNGHFGQKWYFWSFSVIFGQIPGWNPIKSYYTKENAIFHSFLKKMVFLTKIFILVNFMVLTIFDRLRDSNDQKTL